MNVARPGDGLLPATATLKLVELLRRRPEGEMVEQLIRDLAASVPISWSRARNTITKLAQYTIVRITGAKCRLTSGLPDEIRDVIADRVAHDLIQRLSEARAWSCLRFDQASDVVIIDGMTLPVMRDGLGMWVTDFGIAVRHRTQSRLWEVTERYRAVFLSGARSLNAAPPKRAKTVEMLAAELARQALDGAAAELWVLEYERARLRDHPFHDQIRRISEGDVAAGYDIVSFAAPASLQHDLFIEVKSHGRVKAFHWSRNEIATAKEFRDEYALYIVDRARMDQPGYQPHIISGPSPEMFAHPDSGWFVEATSFEHVASGQ